MIVHKIIYTKEGKKRYTCNYAVGEPKYSRKYSYYWKDVTCKNCLKQKPKRKIFRKKYDFECVKCGAKLWARPSLMMTQFGMNTGSGSCMDCGTFLHLEIYPDIQGEFMKSEIWSEWLEKQKKEKQDEKR